MAPAQKTIHILVIRPGHSECVHLDGGECSCSALGADKRKREDSSSVGDPDKKRRRNIEALGTIKIPPSSLSQKAMLTSYGDRIAINQPKADPEILPIALMHEVFGVFLDNYEKHQLTEKDNKLLNELQEAMLQQYEDEIKRANVFRNVFLSLGITLEAAYIGGTKFATDGHVQLEGNPLLITEAKNDWTGLSAAAHLQAFAYYLEFIKEKGNQAGKTPCFLLYYVGRHRYVLRGTFRAQIETRY